MIFFALVNLLGPIYQTVGGVNLIQKSRKDASRRVNWVAKEH
jgi:hypothetical protein